MLYNERMSEAISASTFNCTQCGGELYPDEGQRFITCPFCSSTVFIDKSKVVFHWYIASTYDDEKARSALFRWMSGNDTVKDLDKKAQVIGKSFAYFPLWYFKRIDQHSKETILLEPAAPTAISEIKTMQLPPGDLVKYTPNIDADAEQPTIPLESALERVVENELIPRQEIIESAIVHVPLYRFKYKFQGRDYTALVDAASGKVMANIFPAKEEIPYQLIGGVTATTYLILSIFPLIGGLVGGEAGFSAAIGLCGGLGLLAAPILMSVAAYVSQKV